MWRRRRGHGRAFEQGSRHRASWIGRGGHGKEPLEVGSRRVAEAPIEAQTGDGPVEAGVGLIGRQGQDAVEHGAGRVRPASCQEDRPDPEQGPDIVRIELEGGPIAARGVGEPIGGEERVSKGDERSDIGRIESDAGLELLERRYALRRAAARDLSAEESRSERPADRQRQGKDHRHPDEHHRRARPWRRDGPPAWPYPPPFRRLRAPDDDEGPADDDEGRRQPEQKVRSAERRIEEDPATVPGHEEGPDLGVGRSGRELLADEQSIAVRPSGSRRPGYDWRYSSMNRRALSALSG